MSVKPDGSGLKKYFETAVWSGHPAWSPSGRQIAYSSVRSGNADIWRDSSQQASDPGWSGSENVSAESAFSDSAFSESAFPGSAFSAATGFTTDEADAFDTADAAETVYAADAINAFEAVDAADMINAAEAINAAGAVNDADTAGAADENNDNDSADTETDYLPPVISVREGIMRITLPPESGFLLRWSSVIEE